MSERRERAVSHSLSCTALEWERIRDAAERADKPMSRHIVDRVLGRDGGGGAAQGDAPVLDANRQRAMHDAVVRCGGLMARLVERPCAESPDLGEAVRALFESRLDEMARAGRHDTMQALLDSIVGPERAARILSRVHARVTMRR